MLDYMNKIPVSNNLKKKKMPFLGRNTSNETYKGIDLNRVAYLYKHLDPDLLTNQTQPTLGNLDLEIYFDAIYNKEEMDIIYSPANEKSRNILKIWIQKLIPS